MERGRRSRCKPAGKKDTQVKTGPVRHKTSVTSTSTSDVMRRTATGQLSNGLSANQNSETQKPKSSSPPPFTKARTPREPLHYLRALPGNKHHKPPNGSGFTPRVAPSRSDVPHPQTFWGFGMFAGAAQSPTGAMESLEQSSCLSSDLDGSCSACISSPEVFHKAEDCEPLNSFIKEELLGSQGSPGGLCVKNSTLLDVSHAEEIDMQPPLNLSPIIDTPMSWTKKDNESRGTVAAPTRLPESTASQAIKRFTQKPQSKHPSQTSRSDPFKEDLMALKEAAEPLKGFLKEPVNPRPAQARFFDFACENDRVAFIQRLRDRNARLRNPDLLNRLKSLGK